MRQIWIPRTGGPEVLETREAPDPAPAQGEVRIRVEAAGVNFADLMARLGVYPDAPALPAVVGYEVAGTIDAVGPGVAPDRAGEPVVAATHFGGYSDCVCVPSGQAIERPGGLDALHAAAIPVTGLTAWMMLIEMARVREGDRVLVHSAGGGVGLMALDLLRWRRAIPIGVTSAAKHARLAELGYEQLIDGRQQDFEQVLKGGPGLDLILDPVGGKSWKKGLRLLRPGGKIVLFGFSANATGPTRDFLKVLKNLAQVPWIGLSPLPLINRNLGVLGVNMGRMWQEADRLSGWLSQLLELWKQGLVRPLVHAAVPFDQAAEAHRILHDRENVGKVVLTP